MLVAVTVIFSLTVSTAWCVTPSPGCGASQPSQPHPGHSHSFGLTVNDPNLGDTYRVYKLHVPSAFDTSNNKPTPMVVDFHGWGGDSNSQERDSQFITVSNEDPDGFFVLTAEGMSDMNHRKTEQTSFVKINLLF